MKFFSDKLTSDQRSRAIDSYEQLSNLISTGKWDYPRHSLDSDLKAYKFCSWMLVNKFLVILLILATSWIPIGWIGFLISWILMSMYENGYERYLKALELLKSQPKFNTEAKNTEKVKENDNSIEKIEKLHNLLKIGAISQDEFDAEKKKILS